MSYSVLEISKWTDLYINYRYNRSNNNNIRNLWSCFNLWLILDSELSALSSGLLTILGIFDDIIIIEYCDDNNKCETTFIRHIPPFLKYNEVFKNFIIDYNYRSYKCDIPDEKCGTYRIYPYNIKDSFTEQNPFFFIRNYAIIQYTTNYNYITYHINECTLIFNIDNKNIKVRFELSALDIFEYIKYVESIYYWEYNQIEIYNNKLLSYYI